MSSRDLPAKRNPLIIHDVPPVENLAKLRRLGQTTLHSRLHPAPDAEVDPDAVGIFNYVHLRAPMPKGISSGIFKRTPNSYFLMRRSRDGYVSATGMFKATFPYASSDEENDERQYIRSLPETSSEETAGNSWVPPEVALMLAEEYGIVPWIEALLDPSEVVMESKESPKTMVAPPVFTRGDSVQRAFPPPTPPPSRRLRSASPTKATASHAKSLRAKSTATSPRKRQTSKMRSILPTPTENFKVADGEALSPTAKVGNGDDAIDENTSEDSPESANEEPTVKIHLEQGVEIDDEDEEVKQTKVHVEVPFIGEPPSAEESKRMIARAREMVEDATKSIAVEKASDVVPSEGGALPQNSKRKADEIARGDGEEVDNESAEEDDVTERQAKRVKREVEERKATIKKRAYYGIGATLAVGAIIPLLPYVLNVL